MDNLSKLFTVVRILTAAYPTVNRAAYYSASVVDDTTVVIITLKYVIAELRIVSGIKITHPDNRSHGNKRLVHYDTEQEYILVFSMVAYYFFDRELKWLSKLLTERVKTKTYYYHTNRAFFV